MPKYTIGTDNFVAMKSLMTLERFLDADAGYWSNSLENTLWILMAGMIDHLEHNPEHYKTDSDRQELLLILKFLPRLEEKLREMEMSNSQKS